MSDAIDAVDMKLLKELKENSRENIATLSKKLGIQNSQSSPTIKNLT